MLKEKYFYLEAKNSFYNSFGKFICPLATIQINEVQFTDTKVSSNVILSAKLFR